MCAKKHQPCQDIKENMREIYAVNRGNGRICAGYSQDNSEDTVFLKLQREGDKDFILYLRPDEAQAIALVLIGTVYEGLHYANCK